MIGENFVILIGKVSYPKYKEFDGGGRLLNGKIAIPINNSTQYIKFSAWNDIAESLHSLKKGVFVKIHGHIEERSYDGKCRHCGGADKKFWTEVVVDNFITLNKEEEIW